MIIINCVVQGCVSKGEWRPVLLLDREKSMLGDAPVRVLFDTLCCDEHRELLRQELPGYAVATRKDLISSMMTAQRMPDPAWGSARVEFIPKDCPESLSFAEAVHKQAH